jgi:arylsulfatase A-like enzyme
MKRRKFVKLVAGGSLLSLLPRSGVFAQSSSSTNRPNVLFLFADQHNANALGCMGNPNAFTPNLDHLAAGGTRFDRAYCNDGICMPSRNSLITGQLPRTLGMYDNEVFQASMVETWTPMQKAFKQAGYYTFTTGKRHLLPKVDTDWDYSAGDLPSEMHDNLNYLTWLQQKGLSQGFEADEDSEHGDKSKNIPAAHFGCAISKLPPEATMEAFAAEQTINFLKSPQSKSKPFFAWSTFYRPHQPYTPQQSFVDQINFPALQLPATVWQKADELPPMVNNLRNHTTPPWDLASADEKSYRTYIGYYHALVREIDHHIGSILATLREQGLEKNTLIVYSSDHGDFVGGHGLIEKAAACQCYYEEVLRVPLIFNWPGKISPNHVSKDLVQLVDLYPTIMDLCGIPMPSGITYPGHSLAPTLLRQESLGRKYVVSENWGQTTVIADDYKYGQWVNTPVAKHDAAPAKQNAKGQKQHTALTKNINQSYGNMLMQRSSDPGETKNLVSHPESAPALRQMQGYLAEWLQKTDDKGRREFVAKKAPGAEYTTI